MLSHQHNVPVHIRYLDDQHQDVKIRIASALYSPDLVPLEYSLSLSLRTWKNDLGEEVEPTIDDYFKEVDGSHYKYCVKVIGLLKLYRVK